MNSFHYHTTEKPDSLRFTEGKLGCREVREQAGGHTARTWKNAARVSSKELLFPPR